ncbi:hypothetical protein SLE2022_051500 [Rubroshorea leprosula]
MKRGSRFLFSSLVCLLTPIGRGSVLYPNHNWMKFWNLLNAQLFLHCLMVMPIHMFFQNQASVYPYKIIIKTCGTTKLLLQSLSSLSWLFL